MSLKKRLAEKVKNCLGYGSTRAEQVVRYASYESNLPKNINTTS
jgi:hypothetical protein